MIPEFLRKIKGPNWKFHDIKTPKGELSAVKITSGRWSGVVYRYGKVSFEEREGKLAVQFEYFPIENPTKRKLNKKFENMVGDILVQLLQESVEKGKSVIDEQ